MKKMERNRCIFLGKKRNITFCDKEDVTYLREIAYPTGLLERELKKYVSSSFVRKVSKLNFLGPEDCLIFCKNKNVQEIVFEGLIDKYWITGEVIVVEYVNNNQKEFLEVVIDIELDKVNVYSQVKNIIYSEYKSEHILFYESTNECWIKRM
ncbi:hypothetical protein JZO82_03890 [Vagococcus fluvialis]|uniref:hypothetical protein n=1 Tax=Vagococcus fluvialis TaxID=2738 RepID=UPI001A9036DA|nr:hypothetical protein [Vagococcus fluvialis]MBO0428298.1 hypothetical protein [Vagococcus fluvialis]